MLKFLKEMMSTERRAEMRDYLVDMNLSIDGLDRTNNTLTESGITNILPRKLEVYGKTKHIPVLR